jgi:O-antigen/teichoic acid export membrane protein
VHGVASGYVAMAATILTSLVSVPLALHFLSKDAFGLWALLTQIVNYLMLIDFGMTASVARLLIERKDAKDDTAYARLVHTGFAVGALQGLIVVAIGFAIAPWLSVAFKIPQDAHATFISLVRWQSLLAAGLFAIRTFRNVLFAHQRTDLVNYIQAISLVVNVLALAVWLYIGKGVMSVIWANACLLIFALVANWWACSRLHLFPKSSGGPKFAWKEFSELFSYGRDVFLVQIGSLLIVTTQPMILSRTLGLEAVAIWAVGTKAFTMVSSLVYQVFDVSNPAFAEMMVRQETDRLRRRYREIVAVSIALATVIAVDYAALNTSFVHAWTRGKIEWSISNDILLGLWLVVAVLVHANSGFIVLTKKIGALRYIYLLEGAAFLALGSFLTRRFGIPGLVGASLLCSVIFSGAYGVFAINRFLGHVFKPHGIWLRAPAKSIGILLPIAALYYWATPNLASLYRFALGGVLLGAAAAIVFLRCGVPGSLRPDILQRIPPSFRRDVEKWALPAKEGV